MLERLAAQQLRQVAHRAAGTFEVSYKTGTSSVEQVLAAVRAQGLHIQDIATEDPKLEEVFMALTYAAPEKV